MNVQARKCVDAFDMAHRLRNCRRMPTALASNVRMMMAELREDQTQFGKRFGVSQSTVSRWLKGSPPDGLILGKLATLAGVTVEQVVNERLHGIASEAFPDKRSVEIVGFVGAGAAVYAFEDGDRSERRSVAIPRGLPGNIAVEVKGDSLFPQAEDGWRIIYMGAKTFDEQTVLNKLCVVQLADDRILVKKVLRGAEPGRYHLFSTNAPLIENAELMWAARVEAIIPV